jgi:hypothetical protein
MVFRRIPDINFKFVREKRINLPMSLLWAVWNTDDKGNVHLKKGTEHENYEKNHHRGKEAGHP